MKTSPPHLLHFLVLLLFLVLQLQTNAQVLGASSYSVLVQSFTGIDGYSPCKTCEIDCYAVSGLFSSCENRYYRYGCHINSLCVDTASANTNEFIAAFAICVTKNNCRPTQANRNQFLTFKSFTPLYKLMQNGQTSLQVQYQYFQWDPAMNMQQNYHVKYKRLFFFIMKMHGPFFYYFKLVQDIKDNLSAFRGNPELIRTFVNQVNNELDRLPEWLKFAGSRRWDEGLITRTFRPITYYDVLNVMAQQVTYGYTFMDQIMQMMHEYVERKSASVWNYASVWFPNHYPRFKEIAQTLDMDYKYGYPFSANTQTTTWDQGLVNELNVYPMSWLHATYADYNRIDAEFINRMVNLPCFSRMQYLPKRYGPENIYALMTNDPKLIIDSWFWYPDLNARPGLVNLFNQVTGYEWLQGTVTTTSNSAGYFMWVGGRHILTSYGFNPNPAPMEIWMHKRDSIVVVMTVDSDTMNIPQFIARIFMYNNQLTIHTSSSWYCFEMANWNSVPLFYSNDMDKNTIKQMKFSPFSYAIENDVTPQGLNMYHLGRARWITRNNYYGDYVDYRKRVLTRGTLLVCRYDPPDLQEIVVYS